MSISEVGNAADQTVLRIDAPRQEVPVVPPRSVTARRRDTEESLLDAIRRGLAPADPVARLLASLSASPARPVGVFPGRGAHV